MADDTDVPRVASASREIAASAPRVFELIADPVQQPLWDGNDNLAEAEPGQRVRGQGDVFTMTLTGGNIRENHIVEFEEGRRIAWLPSEPGRQPPGHLWRWELEPLSETRTRVTHTYDWSRVDRRESPATRPPHDAGQAAGIPRPACRDRRAQRIAGSAGGRRARMSKRKAATAAGNPGEWCADV